MQNEAEVVSSFSVTASTLRSVVSAYAAVQDEFHWLFTMEGVEARALDPSRVAMIELVLRPSNYESEVDKVWVFGSVTELAKIVRRFKKAEDVTVEVREDDNFYVGPFKIGSVISEEDVPEWSKSPPITIRPDCKLTVVTTDFRRIVRHAEAEKTRKVWKAERAYEHVGIRVSDGEATIVFFNEECMHACGALRWFPREYFEYCPECQRKLMGWPPLEAIIQEGFEAGLLPPVWARWLLRVAETIKSAKGVRH